MTSFDVTGCKPPGTGAGFRPAFRVQGTLVVLATFLVACHDSAGPSAPDCTAPNCARAMQLVTLPTYDGSGQVVHPDILETSSFAGSPFWLAITPYPSSNATLENPSIFRSANGTLWEIPAGGTNPIERPVTGYLSDPDIIFDPDLNQLRLYYRQVVNGQNIALLTQSTDGVRWDPPIELVSVPSHGLVSPTVVRGAPGGPWLMWAVNSGPQGCNAATTIIEMRSAIDGIAWTAPVATDLIQPGRVIWHIDVEWVPARAEYWAVYNTYPSGGSCVTDELFLARSSDGVHWAPQATPLLIRGVSAAFKDVVYRSTFTVDAKAEMVTFWFSGARYELGRYVWRAATQSRMVADVLAGTRQPPREQLLPASPNLPAPEPVDLTVAH